MSASISQTLDFNGEPITLPPLQPKYEAILQTAYATSIAAVRNEDTATGPWVFNSTQEDVEIFTKKPAGSNTECSKGIGYVDAPPLLVSVLFNSPDWRGQWDGMHDKGERIETVDQFTNINYNSFKAPWPVSGRDFCALSRTVILPPKDVPSLNDPSSTGIGAVFTFSQNIVTTKCPERKGLVRGVLHFCGLWIEAVSGNPNRCKVIYCLGSDPMGSIPKSIVNAANVKQPLCIAAIRGVLQKNPKLRGEVERKIEGEKVKSREFRAKLAATAAAAAELSPASAPSSSPAQEVAAAAASTSPSESSPVEESPADDDVDDDELPPSPYDGILAKAYKEAMAAIRADGATDGWVFNSRQENIDIYMKSTPGSTTNSCKGVGIINCSVATCEMVFNNNMYRTKWDEICLESKEIKLVDWVTGIYYNSFGAPWPVSSRDFVAVGRSKFEPLGPVESPGVMFSWSTSVNDPKLAPLKKGFVRGTLHFAGLWIEPVPGNPNQCKVIYTLSSDPNGSIPKAIVNGANVKQPLCIATVAKFVKNSPDIIEKMRIQQKKEQDVCAKMKADYKQAKKAAKKQTNGHSNSTSASSSSSSASTSLSTATLSTPTGPASQPPSLASFDPSVFAFADGPRALPCAPIVALLRNQGPSLTPADQIGHFVRWEAEDVERLQQEQQEAIKKITSVADSEVKVGIMKMLIQMLMTWIMALFTTPTPPPAKNDEEVQPDPHGSIVQEEPVDDPSHPLIGTLWFELLDLRQIIQTLQTQQLANLMAEKEKDRKVQVPTMTQKVWIHCELQNDVSPQGQVAQATIDLSNGSFIVTPSSFLFKVHHPDAKLAVSLYTQSLDVIHETATITSTSLHTQITSQSIGGKLRNAINPLHLGSQLSSGLESGFDSFVRVFDGGNKGPGNADATSATVKQPHTIVLMGSLLLDVASQLSAPSPEHAKLSWINLEDTEGLYGTNVTTLDELLQSRRTSTQTTKSNKKMANGAMNGQISARPVAEHHPALLTSPIPTFSLLVHSYYVANQTMVFKSHLAQVNQLPLEPASLVYTILFQTLDGVFDVLHVPSTYRLVALSSYEKLQVGISLQQSTSASSPKQKSNSSSSTTPIIVSKLLLSPENHVLQSCFYDLSRKHELLSFARQLLRRELQPCFTSIGNDVLQPRRPLGRIQTVAHPALSSTKTMHTALDPTTTFNPFVFVISYHLLFTNLKGLFKFGHTLHRLLSWTDVYTSFFFWLGFIFLCFYPSFIGFIIGCLMIISLMKSAAHAHFEDHLLHQSSNTPMTDEYEKRKREEKEKVIYLISLLSVDSVTDYSLTVQQLLYLLQSVCVYFSHRTQALLELYQWQNELHTTSLLVYLGWMSLFSLVAPFEWFLILLTLSLMVHRRRFFQAGLQVQATFLIYHKRQYYRTNRVQFPPSTIVLHSIVKQLMTNRK